MTAWLRHVGRMMRNARAEPVRDDRVGRPDEGRTSTLGSTSIADATGAREEARVAALHRALLSGIPMFDAAA